MVLTSQDGLVERKRAAAGCAVCVVFVVGWAARFGLDHVADHRYNWMASNALAAGVNVSARPLGTWMDAWNSTCEGKYGVSLNEPAGATLVDTGAHLGSCDGFARQRELSRAPISAASLSSDPVLALSSAALAAGSYAWHSTGQQDTVHLDHFGCALFALAVARSLLASLDRIGVAWLNGGLCLVVACVCGLAVASVFLHCRFRHVPLAVGHVDRHRLTQGGEALSFVNAQQTNRLVAFRVSKGEHARAS